MSHSRARRNVLFACSFAALAGAAGAAEARILRVNSTADSTGTALCSTATSTCTLRRAFELADQNPTEFFTVHLDAQGSYRLASPLVLRRGAIHVIGNTTDATQIVLDGQSRVTIISIEPASGSFPFVKVEKVSLRNGRTTGTGAAVRIGANGSFDAAESIIAGNTASLWGSGIFVAGNGRASLFRTRVENNVNGQVGACGGGVTSTGGGLAADRGASVDIVNSLFRGNKACRGGGLWAQDAQLHIVNSTFTENEADLRGGGLMIIGGLHTPVATLKFNTIANNVAAKTTNANELAYGGGLAIAGYVGSLMLSGNIIADNRLLRQDTKVTAAVKTPGADCLMESASPQVDSFNNFFGTAGTQGTNVTGTATLGGGTRRTLSDCIPLRTRSFAGFDSKKMSPKLGAPAIRGGGGAVGMPVMMPAADSMVSNAFRNVSTAPTHGCIYTDQRGFLRPTFSMGICDIGAAEIDGRTP